jgi:hypothetical protein
MPAAAIRGLIEQKPAGIIGLSVPGMPIGSPGMEVEGVAPQEYSVFAFGNAGRQLWGRYRGVSRRRALTHRSMRQRACRLPRAA